MSGFLSENVRELGSQVPDFLHVWVVIVFQVILLLRSCSLLRWSSYLRWFSYLMLSSGFRLSSYLRLSSMSSGNLKRPILPLKVSKVGPELHLGIILVRLGSGWEGQIVIIRLSQPASRAGA